MGYKEKQEDALTMLISAQEAFRNELGQTNKDLQDYQEMLTLAEDEFRKREWDNVMDSCRSIFKLRKEVIERSTKQMELL